MDKLIERPEVLQGTTYKIRDDAKQISIFVTINDAIDEEGNRRPYELFINTKYPELFEWMTAICVLTSALLQRVEDTTFLTDKLKTVFGKDSYYSKDIYGNPTQYRSFIEHLGCIIEQHTAECR